MQDFSFDMYKETGATCDPENASEHSLHRPVPQRGGTGSAYRGEEGGGFYPSPSNRVPPGGGKFGHLPSQVGIRDLPTESTQ